MADLKIMSYNVNGIRAAVKKGFIDWLKEAKPDVLCMQEMKVHKDDFDPKPFEALGYHTYLFDAVKKGYSGVAIMSKIKPDKITVGTGYKDYDDEARTLRMDIGDLSVISVYIPSGTTGDIRQAIKMKFLDYFYDFIHKLEKTRSKLVIAGDYNICHKPIDIHDPIRNKDSSGFKPEERAWMDKWFDSGFVDTFRHFNKEPHQYSWWSVRSGARKTNKGWRIDYISVTKNLEKNLVEGAMFQQAMYSDHCPVYCKLKI